MPSSHCEINHVYYGHKSKTAFPLNEPPSLSLPVCSVAPLRIIYGTNQLSEDMPRTWSVYSVWWWCLKSRTHNGTANCKFICRYTQPFRVIVGLRGWCCCHWAFACPRNLILSIHAVEYVPNVCHYFLRRMSSLFGVFAQPPMTRHDACSFPSHQRVTRPVKSAKCGINCGNYKRKAFILNDYRKQDLSSLSSSLSTTHKQSVCDAS